jgi:hypothetical protein
MNERMNELARQSGIGFLSSVPPDMLDKFAELIVKECLTACQRVHDYCEDTTKQFDIDTMQRQIGVNLCKVEIKKLFDLDIR